jgi:hypothetical protein
MKYFVEKCSTLIIEFVYRTLFQKTNYQNSILLKYSRGKGGDTMVNRKNLAIAVLSVFCLTSTLFMIIPTRSESGIAAIGEYDPWIDINDDGTINFLDAILLGGAFGALGEPINKTALLLELESRIEYLETRMPKKGCISVPAVSFVPMDNSTPYRIMALRLIGYGLFFAGLQLPHGAILTNMTAYVYDSVSSGEIHLQLFGLNLTSGNGYVMASVQSGVSETPGYTGLFTGTISYAEVDEQWTYFLSVSFTSQTISLNLAGVMIEYEYST